VKRIANFRKTTTLGGLFVVLPVVVVCAGLARTVLVARNAAQSILEKLTGRDSAAVHFPVLAAVLLVVALSFAIGLAVTAGKGRKAGRIARALFSKLPGYAAVQAFMASLAGDGDRDAPRPALLSFSEGTECFVLVTEDHGNGRLTVFLPNSPNPASESVRIVRKDLVRLLNVRITDVAGALQQWGGGAANVLAKDAATASSGLTTPGAAGGVTRKSESGSV
jgi:uncharacterized membrane protein